MRLSDFNIESRLWSTAGTFGEIQIVTASGKVVVDLFTRNYDLAGHLNRGHALANLSLSAAVQLRDLLSEAIDHAASAELDTRQTRFWPDATPALAAARIGRRPA
jgi:hypothetical protein